VELQLTGHIWHRAMIANIDAVGIVLVSEERRGQRTFRMRSILADTIDRFGFTSVGLFPGGDPGRFGRLR